MTSVTRCKHISCGHRITGHPGKCSNLHGHNYVISVTIEGPVDTNGIVVDFGDIKLYFDWWLDQNWDHRFLIYDQDPDYPTLELVDHTVLGVPFNPTAEGMAEYLLSTWQPLLAEMKRAELYCAEVKLVSVTVQETEKCSATATA